LDWAQLPEKGPDRRQAVAKVYEEHNVSPSYPPKLTKRVANSQGLPLRRGHDAFHEKRIHEEEEELIKEVALCASSGRCGRSLAAAARSES